jgi:hypothetical protein
MFVVMWPMHELMRSSGSPRGENIHTAPITARATKRFPFWPTASPSGPVPPDIWMKRPTRLMPPSSADLNTTPVPMMPEAPGLFSTMTKTCRSVDIFIRQHARDGVRFAARRERNDEKVVEDRLDGVERGSRIPT